MTATFSDERRRAILSNDDGQLQQAWSVCLDTYVGATPRQREELLESVSRLRDEFVFALDAVSDKAEQEYLSTMFFTALKCQWTILSIYCGYAISGGNVDLKSICRCGLLSALLGRVERLLPPTSVSQITQFLNVTLFPALGTTSDGYDSDLYANSSVEENRVAQLLQSRINQLEFELSEAYTRQQTLFTAVGTSNIDEIIRRCRPAEQGDALLDELESALNNMESSMLYLDVR